MVVQIDAFLARIADKTYGVCQATGRRFPGLAQRQALGQVHRRSRPGGRAWSWGRVKIGVSPGPIASIFNGGTNRPMSNQESEASSRIEYPARRSVAAWGVLLAVVLVGLVLDLWTKQWAFEEVAGTPVRLVYSDIVDGANPIPWHDGMRVVGPDLLDFRLVLNRGAVFGIGQGRRVAFVLFTVVAIVVAVVVFGWWTRARAHLAHIAIGLILAGGLATSTTVSIGAVRDFLHLLLPRLLRDLLAAERPSLPLIFNLADVELLLGMVRCSSTSRSWIDRLGWPHAARRRRRSVRTQHPKSLRQRNDVILRQGLGKIVQRGRVLQLEGADRGASNRCAVPPDSEFPPQIAGQTADVETLLAFDVDRCDGPLKVLEFHSVNHDRTRLQLRGLAAAGRRVRTATVDLLGVEVRRNLHEFAGETGGQRRCDGLDRRWLVDLHQEKFALSIVGGGEPGQVDVRAIALAGLHETIE